MKCFFVTESEEADRNPAEDLEIFRSAIAKTNWPLRFCIVSKHSDDRNSDLQL